MKGLIKMAQTKIKTLRNLSIDQVNSIEFISGRAEKQTQKQSWKNSFKRVKNFNAQTW